jgi:hypothetical protein
MQILVRHDDTIQGSERLTAMTVATIENTLYRFANRITTIEVHYGDEDGKKSRGDDIRCCIEVRIAGNKPTAVTHRATDLPVALALAAEKAARMLDHHLGRLRKTP